MRTKLHFVLALAIAVSLGGCARDNEPTIATPAEPDASKQLARAFGKLLETAPGEIVNPDESPRILSETAYGRELIAQGTRGYEAYFREVELHADSGLTQAMSGVASGLSGGTASGAASGGSASLPTSPSFGSGSVASAPATGGSSIPSAPSWGGGSIPTSTTLGNGATVKVDPTVAINANYLSGAASGGGSVASGLCSTIRATFGFYAKCGGETMATLKSKFDAAGNCESILEAELGEVLSKFPPQLAAFLSCVSTEIDKLACGTGDLSPQLAPAYSACGVTISQ